MSSFGRNLFITETAVGKIGTWIKYLKTENYFQVMFYCRVGHKLNSHCVCIMPFIFSSSDTSYIPAPLSHYFHMQLSPKMTYLSHRGTNVPIPCWFKCVSCLIKHYVTTVSFSSSILHLWSPEVSLSAGNRCYTFGAKLRRCSQNQRTYCSYITRDVTFFFWLTFL
jgi:hypothetical protein